MGCPMPQRYIENDIKWLRLEVEKKAAKERD